MVQQLTTPDTTAGGVRCTCPSTDDVIFPIPADILSGPPEQQKEALRWVEAWWEYSLHIQGKGSVRSFTQRDYAHTLYAREPASLFRPTPQ